MGNNNSVQGTATSVQTRTPFGKEMLKHFLFDPDFKNLNHGSFGTFPRSVRDKQRQYSDLCEARPDPFIRYDYPEALDVSRAAVAKLLNAPLSTVVYVPNATSGVNTVLRNLVWNRDGRDEILYFNTIYGACGKTVSYISEASHNIVNGREVQLQLPMEDSETLTLFKKAIRSSRAEGKNPRIAIFDTVSSLPGIRMPFERLTAVCREEGVMSLIDGAHGIGHVHLDMTALEPDFFTSNCHKWLFVPRGCAVLYVPERNQPLMRSTLPTSHGFEPKGKTVGLPNPLAFGSTNSPFVQNFEFVGTIDNTNYLVVPDAIKWREQFCGGETAIIEYNTDLAQKGGELVAEMLGTEVMDNSTHTLTNCCLVNVRLPLTASPTNIPSVNTIDPVHSMAAVSWMEHKLADQHKTFLAIYFFQNQWWARLSAQIYLDLSDFQWAGNRLKEISERVGKENF